MKKYYFGHLIHNFSLEQLNNHGKYIVYLIKQAGVLQNW